MIEKYGETKPLYTLYTGVETFSFIFFLYVQIKNRVVKNAAFATGVAFIFFIVMYAIFTNETSAFDSIPIGVETIIVLIFSFYYLYEQMNDTTTLYIYSTFSFWIVTGMVLYLSGSFFIYIFAGFISENEVNKFWFITNIFSIFKNILFTIGIIVNSTPPKNLSMPD